MSANSIRPTWTAISASVRGATHVRAGLPNQDAVRVETAEDGRLRAILAVSDGHGSPKCFRSQVGSQLAVDVAVAVLRDFAPVGIGMEPHEFPGSVIAGEIVRRWRMAVANHLAANPIAEPELAALDPAIAERIRLALHQGESYVIYGATLVCAVASGNWLACLQLGDGEILAAKRGPGGQHLALQPLAADAELIANATTSLCQPDAANRFRWKIQSLVDSPPDLLLLATDGYPNSFATPEGFRQVATDLLSMLDQEGVEPIAAALPGWLEEASQQGSGDDVTVAILYAPRVREGEAPAEPRP